MKSFGLTDKGKVRSDNQDCFIIEKCISGDCVIASLCDGMGGARAGGIASRLSDKAFVDYVFSKVASGGRKTDYRNILERACEEANGVSYEYSHFDDAYNGMGTTLVGGVVLNNGRAYFINVGDSRAYLISTKRKTITQITRDHSMVEDLVESGVISREQAKNHPQKNVITRALGTDETVECDYYEFRMNRGDILLLCSDGLSNIISDEEILYFAENHQEPESLCRVLMAEALNRDAADNVTVAAVLK